ncbi:MAG: VacJ family lipoprotein [Smithellaceae bacterium]|nr:VacJ family lipoprotein [Smithellaceae bacterium]
MKIFLFPVLLFLLIGAGCAHRPEPAATLVPSIAAHQPGPVATASSPAQLSPQSPELPAKAENKNADEYADVQNDDYGDIDIPDENSERVKLEIADPLEPFNRAMFHFNDNLYFWFLKPVAQGYGKVVPEVARVSVGNFFSNLTFPIRFVNSLLQGNFKGAASELGRFTVNTLWGVGGLLDPASSKNINLAKYDEDFGQTLGVYGLGHGFFINWPIFGPSSPRDTLGMVGDAFLHPLSYLTPASAGTGVKAYDKVNDTSLRIGDYESLKQAAIDPYLAVRDAYVQYRLKKVKKRDNHLPPGDDSLSPKK